MYLFRNNEPGSFIKIINTIEKLLIKTSIRETAILVLKRGKRMRLRRRQFH